MGSGFLTPRESTMRGCLWWGRVGCSGSLAAQSRENQRCRCRGCARAPRAPRRPACLDGCVRPCSSFALRAQTCVHVPRQCVNAPPIDGMCETGESKSAMQEHLREGLLHRGSSRRSVLSSKRRALSTGSARCRAVAATSLGLAVTTTGGAVLRLSARTMASRACVSALHSS